MAATAQNTLPTQETVQTILRLFPSSQRKNAEELWGELNTLAHHASAPALLAVLKTLSPWLIRLAPKALVLAAEEISQVLNAILILSVAYAALKQIVPEKDLERYAEKLKTAGKNVLESREMGPVRHVVEDLIKALPQFLKTLKQEVEQATDLAVKVEEQVINKFKR